MHVAGGIGLAMGLLATATPAAGATGPGDEIAALQAIKGSLSPAERKLDSRLAVTLRLEKDRRATVRVPSLRTGVAVTASGTTEVDIRTRSAAADLTPRLLALGANVRYRSPRTGEVRAAVPLRALGEVAAWDDVDHVGEAALAMTARMGERAGTKAQRAAEPLVAAALVQSEGDRAHAADTVRTRDRVTGIGTKLCALSDGVDSLTESQAAGELPAVDVLSEQSGDGDEGTAMLEILHDVAPGAELGFATAFTSDASFADNIRALRFTAGCDVIVDDVLYYNESPFQDGPIAQSVDAVTADGALYFSAAGNEGNTLDGTSGNYEGDFRGSGRGVGKFAGEAHDFDPGPAVQVFDPLSAASTGVPVTLFWADPLGAATSDYDLYLVNAAGNVVAFSQDVQDGDDDPYEILGTPLAGAGLRLAVVRFSGSARYFQLSALRGRFKASADGLPAWASPGVSRGHSAAANAFSTAAAPAGAPYDEDLEPGDPPNPRGPFPNLFTAAQLPERFTSDGPRRIFFSATGAPITPGNYSSTGGVVRSKPDITAADGVNTTLGGPFTPFFGTSAAAPHAAAIAALVLSGNPGATEADVREVFNATALDLAPAGVDSRTGHGLLRADHVIEYTGATPQPLARAQQPALTVPAGDGDPYLERGETGTLRLPVTNTGDATALGVSVTVSTGDPQALVTPRARSYGDIPVGETRTQDYQLALAPGYTLGKPVRLAVRVTFAGALSPTTSTSTVPTGQPATTATRFAYAGPPVAIPDASALGASVNIDVAGIGYGSRIVFSVDGETCTTTTPSTTVGIAHSFVGDLTGTLTAPDGNSARLFQRAGGGGNNLCQVVFDDAAGAPFSSVVASRAPFTGTWRPDQPLAALLADPVDGTWKFRVVDSAPQDIGSIRAVSLEVTGFAES